MAADSHVGWQQIHICEVGGMGPATSRVAKLLEEEMHAMTVAGIGHEMPRLIELLLSDL